jgi:hypothetical protein
MRRASQPISVGILTGLALLLAVGSAMAEQSGAVRDRLPFLRAPGARFVDPSGAPVTLKGCNLGNYLLLEPWMFGGCITARDQADIFSTLADRFGPDRRDQLLGIYRSSYITPRDFELIKSFGFNVVRLPFHYSLIQDDTPPYAIKPNAFVHFDRLLEMADAAGVYVILDLHGAPGGQSKDMPTGQAGQNHLWTDQVAQQRTRDIWRAIAARYRDRSVVVAYDLLNEPYGDFKQNLRPDILKLVSSLYTTIREVDDRHVIFAPGPIQKGIEFYGEPKEHGWHDLGFTEHFYPGLFGSKTAVESHIVQLTREFPRRKVYLDRIGAPYFVGEFNVVHSATGGNRMMREYYDRIAGFGWTGTMWAYKLLSARGHGDDRDVWYAVTNTDPLPKLDLHTSSFEDFEKFFRSLATTPLSVNEPLRAALTTPNPEPLPLPRPLATPPPVAVPLSKEWNTSGSLTRGTTTGPTTTAAAGRLWQEVAVKAGRRYRFSATVTGDDSATKDKPRHIELRLQNTLDGQQLVLNTAVADKPQSMSVDGTSLNDQLCLVVVVSEGDGSIEVNDISLADVTDATGFLPR